MPVTRYVTVNVRRESRDPYRTVPNLTGPTALLWLSSPSWRLVTYRADRDAMMALTREVPA